MSFWSRACNNKSRCREEMNNLPFFSVIIPVYNRGRVISNSIVSVINQTFDNWELIIIDDNSNDDTFESISSFKDSRIVYLKNERNSGPAFSRNRGIIIARGEVISFLDSDDRFYPDFLKSTYLYLIENNKIGFCWTGLEVKYKHEIKKELWIPKTKNSPYYSFLKDLSIGSGCGLSIRREIFQKCGLFNEELSAAEDTEFLLRIVQKFEFGVIEDTLIFIDKSGNDRLSLNYERNAISYNKFINQHWSTIICFPDLKKKFYYKLMWLNFHLGDFTLARVYYKRYIDEFGFTKKVYLLRMLFEVFGKKIGSRIHIIVSS